MQWKLFILFSILIISYMHLNVKNNCKKNAFTWWLKSCYDNDSDNKGNLYLVLWKWKQIGNRVWNINFELERVRGKSLIYAEKNERKFSYSLIYQQRKLHSMPCFFFFNMHRELITPYNDVVAPVFLFVSFLFKQN